MERKTLFDLIIAIILLAACLALAVGIYLKFSPGNDSAASDQMMRPDEKSNLQGESVVNVSAMKTASSTFTQTVSVAGTIIDKARQQTLSSTVTGTVTDMEIEEGQYLKQGDVICTIDPSKPGTVYKSVEVKAIASGKVTEVSVIKGMEVGSGTTLLIIDPTPVLRIRTSLPQKLYAQIDKGTKATFTSETYPDMQFEATVSYKSDSIDTDSWTFDVEFETAGVDKLVEGMYVRMEVATLSLENAISIPKKAVSTSADGEYVYLVEDGKAVQRTVSTGEQSGSQIVITDGLSVGDMVITAGTVVDQSPVKIV